MVLTNDFEIGSYIYIYICYSHVKQFQIISYGPDLPIMTIMLVLVLGPVADLDVCFVDPRQTDG